MPQLSGTAIRIPWAAAAERKFCRRRAVILRGTLKAPGWPQGRSQHIEHDAGSGWQGNRTCERTGNIMAGKHRFVYPSFYSERHEPNHKNGRASVRTWRGPRCACMDTRRGQADVVIHEQTPPTVGLASRSVNHAKKAKIRQYQEWLVPLWMQYILFTCPDLSSSRNSTRT